MIQVTLNTDRYICFDENGDINKVARSPDENFENLLVDFEEVRRFAEGKETLRDYKVEYDFIEKKYVFKSKQQYNDSFNTQNFVYEIPKDQDSFEVKIKQNNVDKCWELELDKEFEQYIKSQNISIDPSNQIYSVTKLYDPNVLYKTLNFTNTHKIPFDSKFEFDKINVSLYTIRKFSTYYHEVVNG